MTSTLDLVCRYYRQGHPWPTCSLGVDLEKLAPRIIDRPCIARSPDSRLTTPVPACDKREPMTQADKDEYMAPFKLAIEKIASGKSPCCDALTVTHRTPNGRRWSEAVVCSKCGSMCSHACGGEEVP